MTNSPERKLKLRVKLCSFAALGPGKIDLLEAVHATGSISGAARRQRMSYRRAWMLIDELNKALRAPVIDTQFGGKEGGGARVTGTGLRLIELYRDLQRKAETAVADELDAIAGMIAPDVSERQAEAEKLHGRIEARSDWSEDESGK